MCLALTLERVVGFMRKFIPAEDIFITLYYIINAHHVFTTDSICVRSDNFNAYINHKGPNFRGGVAST